MPQIVLEYSENLVPRLDDATLFEGLHRLVADAGGLARERIKSRILRHERFSVGDGNPSRGFAHLSIALLSGKRPEVKARIGEAALRFLEEIFPGRHDPPPSLTVEIREIDAACYFKAPPTDVSPLDDPL